MPRLNDELDQLFAEGEDGAQYRERTAFDTIIGSPLRQIALFGAGNLGRRTLKGLRKIGLEPVCFLDNDNRRWGTSVDDLPVRSPKEGSGLLAEDCVVLVTIWGALGTDRMDARLQSLRKLGYRHVHSFVSLYWKYPDLFLPHYAIDLPHRVVQSAVEVQGALGLMADEASRKEFVAQVRFRLLGDFQGLPDPVSGPIYFQNDLFSIHPDEVFVDCGAFDGDTLDLFLRQSEGQFKRVMAFEPDPSNYKKLSMLFKRLPKTVQDRITLYHAATGHSNSVVNMNVGAGPASQVGVGDYNVECVTLDSALGNIPPTIIKMDIEGSEIPTLDGAAQFIRNHHPILAVSAYHRQSDLWTIPLLMHEMNPKYSIYMRPHDLEGWDLVCYAIPPDRAVRLK